jgi:nucleoside-diphosphate-sugar epimerase
VKVTALSRNPDSVQDNAPHLVGSGLNWTQGSVATLSPEAFDGEKFDVVIHLATEADMNADPAAAVAVITEGTRRVLNVATQCGARRFLLTSSGAIYGPQPRDMERMLESFAGEQNPSDTNSPYALPGEAKRDAELLCIERARVDGLGAVIARGFTFAGPGLPGDSKFAIGNFIRDALAGGPIVIKGDGSPIRSYLYAADMAIWLWTLLLKGVPGRPYNVGSENPITIRELAGLISEECGGSPVKILKEPMPWTRPERYLPSTARARDELGLGEGFNLRDMVRKTAAWNRANVKH